LGKEKGSATPWEDAQKLENLTRREKRVTGPATEGVERFEVGGKRENVNWGATFVAGSRGFGIRRICKRATGMQKHRVKKNAPENKSKIERRKCTAENRKSGWRGIGGALVDSALI